MEHSPVTRSETSSPEMSDISPGPPTYSEEPAPRCAPTSLYPQPRCNLRASFRGLQSVATIIVGTANSKSHPETTYTVHRDLLTSASPFFAAALNGTFAEGLDQTVKLPEEKPDIFEWFIWWLYTGSLVTPSQAHLQLCPPDSPRHAFDKSHGPSASIKRHMDDSSRDAPRFPTHLHPTPPHNHPHYNIPSAPHNSSTSTLSSSLTHTDGDLRNPAGSPKYFLLLDLYALSDRLLTSNLSNHICDTIARLSESTNSVPTPSDTWILYDTIRDSAPVRRLVLDLFAYKKTDKLLEGHKDEWHPRFLRELVVKLKRPGPESVDRHFLSRWRPSEWSATRACEACRELLKPGVAGEKCEVCDRAFCAPCLRREGRGVLLDLYGGGGSGVGGGYRGTGAAGEMGCKPWMKGGCARYHDHMVPRDDV